MKGIYKITNLINGKVYIGQSIDIKRRWHEEKYKKKNNLHLYRSFKKYGLENFSFDVLEECDNLDEREIYWIAYYDSNNRNKGYNQTSGGNGIGTTLSEELKQKIRESVSGEKNGFYGKKHTEKTKKILSEKAKLKTYDKNPKARKLINITTGEIFTTIKEAVEKYNVCYSTMMYHLNGKLKTVKKCVFEYYKGEEN